MQPTLGTIRAKRCITSLIYRELLSQVLDYFDLFQRPSSTRCWRPSRATTSTPGTPLEALGLTDSCKAFAVRLLKLTSLSTSSMTTLVSPGLQGEKPLVNQAIKEPWFTLLNKKLIRFFVPIQCSFNAQDSTGLTIACAQWSQTYNKGESNGY